MLQGIGMNDCLLPHWFGTPLVEVLLPYLISDPQVPHVGSFPLPYCQQPIKFTPVVARSFYNKTSWQCDSRQPDGPPSQYSIYHHSDKRPHCRCKKGFKTPETEQGST